MKNPKKVTDLFKTINDKLQGKLQSGEISQDELLKEVSEIMAKIKGGKGDFDFQEILKNMSGGGSMTKMINEMKGMFQPNRKANTNDGPSEINVDGVPFNKWFHVAIRIENKVLDVHVNGAIASRHVMKFVPKQNYNDVNVC